MATRIKPKRSSTASAAPLAGDLDAGELAINLTDGRIYSKTDAGAIKTLGVSDYGQLSGLPTLGTAASTAASAYATAAQGTKADTAHSWGDHALAGYLTSAEGGAATTANALTTARTISLGGDVTGSVAFDGSANVTITAAIADDSHAHVIGNVDGLQTALDGKATADQGAKADTAVQPAAIANSANWNTAFGWGNHATQGYLTTVSWAALTGKPTTFTPSAHTHPISEVTGLQTAIDSKLPTEGGTLTGALNVSPTITNASPLHVKRPAGTQVSIGFDTQTYSKYLGLGSDGNLYWSGDENITTNGSEVFHDGYHPNADALTTARTISLGGDVTGSASFNGSSNVTITATVADDSHNHVISNVDGLQTALDGKAASSHTHSTSQVTGLDAALALKASLASPALTGTPTVPTAVSTTNTAQIASTAFVKAVVADLVAGAPGTIDTLNELAAALGDDPNFATTTATSLSEKLVKTANLSDLTNAATARTNLGLGTAATTASTAYATAAQGTLATTAHGWGNHATQGYLTTVSWTALTGKPTTFTPSAHTHAISEVTGLQTALDGKAASSHTHTTAQVTGLDTALAGKATTAQGTLADSAVQPGDNISTLTNNSGYITSADGGAAATAATLATARTIALGGDVTGSASFNGSANVTITATIADDSHSHVISNVDGLQTALDGKLAVAGTAANSNLLDSINSTSFLRSDVDDDIAGNLKFTGGKGLSFEASGNQGFILHPGGAIGQNNSNGIACALEIKFPVPLSSTDMISLWIDVYDYTTSESFSVFCGGYIYQSGSWINTFASIHAGLANRDFNVRFGHDGVNPKIWIGETSSVWYYPQVSVRDVQVGYTADVDAYKDGWSVNFVTSFGTVVSTHSDNFVVARTAKTLATARTISLGGDVSGSASFNGSANVTITATIADDSHNHVIANVDGLQTALDGKLATTANAVSATKLVTPRSIALGGDVTGSASFDGSANITITATIADDSHNHVISNVDGLQTALDGKAASSHTHTTAQVTGLDTALAGKASLTGATYTGGISGVSYTTTPINDRVKFSVWSGDVYGIGMGATYTYGHLNNYAMTFQMDNTSDRGWWWGTLSDTNAQGSMSLTNAGKLHVGDSITVGTTTNNVFTLADVASQAEAEAGTDNTSPMTPLRTAQAIEELAGGGGLTAVGIKNDAYTVLPNENVLTDTTAGAFTITLPASPAFGTELAITDIAGTWDTNNLTVARNGSTIEGAAEDLVCDLKSLKIVLVYTGVTWSLTAETGGYINETWGTAAVQDVEYFATAAQGTLAGTAVQPAAIANSTNWNTAFGWGNHASAGYATSAQGTSADTAFGWGNHASAGYATPTSVEAQLFSKGTITASDLDLSTGNSFEYALTGAATLTFSNVPTVGMWHVTVTATGTQTLAWPTLTEMGDDTALDPPAAGETRSYTFWTYNGTTIYGGASK